MSIASTGRATAGEATAEEWGWGMATTRALALTVSLALCGATIGALVDVAPAGATSAGTRRPSVLVECPPRSRGHVSCLTRVIDRRTGTGQTAAASTSTPAPGALAPSSVATAYGFPSGGGSGETIALVDAYNDPTATGELSTFSNEYGLPPCTTSSGCFQKVDQTGGGSYPANATPGWAIEESMDIEWAHGLAPSAHIVLVEATTTSYTDMFAAVRYAAQHAQYVSMSWGGTEFLGETTFNSDFSATPTVSFFAASGDTASQVLYPSASPDVISVGGTTLTVTPSTHAWRGETAWTQAGGGCSRYESAAAAQKAYPTYDQSGATCSGFRGTPDISFDANPSTGVSVYDSVPLYTGRTGWFQVGGTSASTVMAAARSAIAGAHVDAAYLYGSNVLLYDVKSGSNGHPCEVGYDLCTGLGSWNTAVGVVNAGGGSLSFTPSQTTLTAGVASNAMSIRLSEPAPSGGLAVTLSASSGGFAPSAAGPFTTSGTVTVLAGQSVSAPFYFQTTTAGSASLSASAGGWSPASQTDPVDPGPLATIVVSPAQASVPEAASQVFSAEGFDAYGNAEPVSPRWSAPGSVGTLTPPTGSLTTFTAAMTPATFTLSASAEGIVGTASVTVTGLASMTVSVTASSPTKARHKGYAVPLTVAATSPSGPLAGAGVTLQVYWGSCAGPLVASFVGSTGSVGTASFTFTTAQGGSYCAAATVRATGYRAGTGTVAFTVGTTPPKKHALIHQLGRLSRLAPTSSR